MTGPVAGTQAAAERRTIGPSAWVPAVLVVVLAGVFLVGSLVYLLPPRNQPSVSVGIYIVNLDGPPVSLSAGSGPGVVLMPGERTTFEVNRAPSLSAVYLDIRQVDNGKSYLHYPLVSAVGSRMVIVRWPGFAYIDSAGQP